MMDPIRLPARNGWQWIKEGFALFMKAPLLWITFIFIGVIAAILISSIPVIGEPLVTLIMPVVLVGLMAGCRALVQGEELELAHLFVGFKNHVSPLVTLGGISLAGQYLILGLMMAVGGATLVSLLMSGQPDTDPNVLIQAAAGAGFAVLLGVVLFSLLMMAMQFAPLLVYFRNVPPVEAMKLSLRAFIYNALPMLVYGITFILLAIFASIPMLLGWVVLLPIVFTSLYASYSDIFPPLKDVPPGAAVENDQFTPDNNIF